MARRASQEARMFRLDFFDHYGFRVGGGTYADDCKYSLLATILLFDFSYPIVSLKINMK